MHIRTQIRKAVTAKLAGIPALAQRVYSSRVHPVRLLPCANVLVLEDTVNTDNVTLDDEDYRELGLTIELYAEAANAAEDALDNLCVVVEKAIYELACTTLRARDIRVMSTRFEYSGEGDQMIAIATLTVLAECVVSVGNPEQAIIT